ncbi:MAG: prenyltransferase/squalene oxidase repeat-containing protein [Burkholderiaceae bacterium]
MKYWIEHAKDRLGLSFHAPQSIETHLEAAAAWILEAQRATPDDGVAHSYNIRTGTWMASYPETTGYVIPTLYDYAKYFDKPVYRDAALKMARWEVTEQLPDGGVRAGTLAAEVVAPTIFNTGQVLFGLARAAKETGDDAIHEGLIRASEWLVAAQDDDGCWRRYVSPFAHSKNGTYNTRSAFGLVRAFEVVGDPRYLESADRNVAWALSTSQANGWLPGNCLTTNPDDRALTHTIAYSIRGILEVGVATENPQYIKAALGMARRVAERQNDDGSLSGYISPEWEPLSNWCCVTGNSQMALNWYRIAKVTGEHDLMKNAVAANRFNMRLQKLDGPLTMRGAMKGSHPIGEEYMTWRFPNWATKFYMDGLMFERLFDRIDNIG